MNIWLIMHDQFIIYVSWMFKEISKARISRLFLKVWVIESGENTFCIFWYTQHINIIVCFYRITTVMCLIWSWYLRSMKKCWDRSVLFYYQFIYQFYKPENKKTKSILHEYHFYRPLHRLKSVKKKVHKPHSIISPEESCAKLII